MGDEAQKRTTDCVYFLASPLTCKKGNDCEYRHSEAARINPRDCWYWLSGNCLNANCSFRHPPLDGRPGASTSAPSPVTGGSSAGATTAAAPGIALSSTTVQVATPASKSTVPCYFFAQGFCAKGGKCPFSHGPPTHFRKEATSYRKPQASEQPANGEGNGFSNSKQQFKDSKLASQLKSPVKTGAPSQEAGFFPSNVYRLIVPGGPTISAPSVKHLPVFAGEKTDRSSQIVKSKLVHNADDSSRQGQSVESRIPQAQFAECLQQVPPSDKDAIKCQLLHLERGITKQGRQSSISYNAGTSKGLISLEMQDELEELHGARDLHSGDLRNHLKRKKNDTAYLSQLKIFQGKEYSKDRLESGRLASRAVAVVESKDFIPSNSKRAKQDQEASAFSGPKTLAQIKAEKTKAGTDGNLRAADSLNGCRGQGQSDFNDTIASNLGVNKKVRLAPDLHDKLRPESSEDCIDSAAEEPEFEVKEALVPISSATKGFEGSSERFRPGVGTKDSNGLSSESVLFKVSREVDTAAFHSSESAVKQDGHELDMPLSIMSQGKEGTRDLRNEGGVPHSRHNVDVLEGSVAETDNISADDLIEEGIEGLENVAVTEYNSDYDEEDDFARKLGSFLS